MRKEERLQKVYDEFHVQVYKEAFPPADFLKLAEECRKGPVGEDGKYSFPYDSYYISERRLRDLSDKWFKKTKLPSYKKSGWGMIAFLGITPSSNEKICKKLFEESEYAKLQGEERIRFAMSWLLMELSHRCVPTFHYVEKLKKENPFIGHDLPVEQVLKSWEIINKSMSLTEKENKEVEALLEEKFGEEFSRKLTLVSYNFSTFAQ